MGPYLGETELTTQRRVFNFSYFELSSSAFRLGFPESRDRSSASLMIERLRVRIPEERRGEFSSPKLTLCACSYSVSVPPRVTAVARKRPRSFYQKCEWQVIPEHAYTLDRTKWVGYALSRHSEGTYQERAHTQLVREQSATVISAR